MSKFSNNIETLIYRNCYKIKLIIERRRKGRKDNKEQLFCLCAFHQVEKSIFVDIKGYPKIQLKGYNS